MSRYSKLGIWMFTLSAAFFVGPTVGAQQAERQPSGADAGPAETSGRQSAPSSERGNRQQSVHQASKVLAVEVRSQDGKALGKIQDLALDPKSGEIRYAAFSVGGAPGVGEKLVAVPWNSFNVQASQGGELAVSSSARKQQLEKAQTLQNDGRWPSQAGSAENLAASASERMPRSERRGAIARDSHESSQMGSDVVRASQLMNATVSASNADQTGKISDMAIDPKAGRVTYVALNAGNLLGTEEKLVAVPWDGIQFGRQQDGKSSRITLLISPLLLKSAPALAEDNWPASAQIRVAARQTRPDIQDGRQQTPDTLQEGSTPDKVPFEERMQERPEQNQPTPPSSTPKSEDRPKSQDRQTPRSNAEILDRLDSAGQPQNEAARPRSEVQGERAARSQQTEEWIEQRPGERKQSQARRSGQKSMSRQAESRSRQSQSDESATRRRPAQTNQAGASDPSMPAQQRIYRAGNLIGVEVTDVNQEPIGQIEDVAIAPLTGLVEYVAIRVEGREIFEDRSNTRLGPIVEK